MVKKSLKLSSIIFLLLLLFTSNISANNEEDIYHYDEYHVSYVVNDDNTIRVKERMVIDFTQSRRGIIRNIPSNWELVDENGVEKHVYAQISDIKCNTEYEVSNSNESMDIKIGDPSHYIQGKVLFELEYTFNLGTDKFEDKDLLYMNLIGKDYNTYIDIFSFDITMPKEFNSSEVHVNVGPYGTSGVNSADIELSYSGNKIMGYYKQRLQANNPFTIKINLEEGYFANAKDLGVPIFYYAIPVISLLVAAILWFKYGKDYRAVKVLNFTPPRNYNPIDVCYMYNKSVEYEDLLSLIIYLANKGYIQIDDIEMSEASENFVLRKIKDYDGTNEHESIFMNVLFKDSNVVNKDYITGFCYEGLDMLKNIVNNDGSKLIYEKKNKAVNIAVILLCVLNIAISGFYINNNHLAMLESYLMIALFTPVIIVFTLEITKNLAGIYKTITLAAVTSFSLFGFILTRIIELNSIAPYIMPYVYTSLIASVLIAILGVLMPRRNKEANMVYGEILGFREFLKTAEKSRLEALVYDDPKYFYDILPYAAVLGVSKKWIGKFTSIHIQNPDYYDGSYYFYSRTYYFNRFISSASTSINNKVNPSSSGSGGFSAGGFSGGGGGGGGSSSW